MDVEGAVDGASMPCDDPCMDSGLLDVEMTGDVFGILKPLMTLGAASGRRASAGASFDRNGSRAAFAIGCRTVDVMDIDSRTLSWVCQDE